MRCLPRAVEPDGFEIDGDRIVVGNGARRIDIGLADAVPRRIALLTLPVLHVRLSFIGYRNDEIVNRLAAFDRAFQRGGG